jgi:hypothetical protein
MVRALKFPSQAWCVAAAGAMERDPSVIAAVNDFGPVVAGVVIEGLKPPFCVLARIAPGKPTQLEFPEDEDELEEMEPDYIGWVSYELCRSMLQATFAGQRPDPLKPILRGEVKLHGDLQRLVVHAGKHQGAGLDALRTVATEFV